MTRLLNWLLVVIILVLGLPFYWLMLDNRPGDARSMSVSISHLRNLAETGEGKAPAAIRYEQVASKWRSGNLRAAGSGIRLEQHFVQSFMLEIPGSRPILIDTGMSAGQARRFGYGKHSVATQDKVKEALRDAGVVVTLGEGIHHEGGLTGPHNQAATGKLPARIMAASSETAPASPFVISRGVVVIPASGMPQSLIRN